MGPRLHIPDGPHPCSIRQNGFTACIEDAGENVCIDHRPASRVLDHATQHKAAGTHRPGEIGLIARVLKATGIEADPGEFQLGGPRRADDHEGKQQRQQGSP